MKTAFTFCKRQLGILSLVIGLWWADGLTAADVSQIILYKGKEFSQTGTGTPVLQSGTPYYAGTFVSLTSANSVTNATLRLPSTVTTNLSFNGDGTQLQLQDLNFASQAAMDAVFGSGYYTYTLKGRTDGTKTVALYLSGDAYPAAPRISNFTAAQAVDPANNFTVTWDAFANGSVNDYVQFVVSDANDQNDVYRSGDPGGAGALDGTSTSFQIPGGTLSSGQTYTGRLLRYRPSYVDSTSYGFGVVGLAGYYSETIFTIVTTGQTDTNAPSLMNSQPWSGETNVPVHSGVAFTFSEPMQSGYSIAWTGVNGNNFSYAWSDDKTTLFCLYNINLPLNTTIGWTLNPSSTNYNFRDLAGNFLQNDIQGSFTTAPTNSTGIKDVRQIVVYKQQSYFQTNSTPLISSDMPYGFGVNIDLTAKATATNASFQLPSTVVQTLSFDGTGSGDEYQLNSGYTNQAAMDADYPDGTYTVTVKTVHDGTRTLVLPLTGGTYPPVPTVSSFSGTQAVVHSNNFTLSWNAFTGGTTNDFVEVRIENTSGNYASYFETPQPGQPGALNGTHTSVVIPANTLYPGRTYSASLMFAKLVTKNTNSYPGVLGIAAYARGTQFTIQTAGTPLKPRLMLLPRNQGQFQMRLFGEPGFNYSIQIKDDLRNGVWIPYWYQTMDSRSATGDYTDFGSTFSNSRFYRAVEEP